jgi:NAD(P)-dependent dehydrogenase (short-subunit alcohol dehydrogenase family)
MALAQAGATIAVHDRSEEQSAEVCQLLSAAGMPFAVFHADLVDVTQCYKLIEDVAHAGRLDILVNCAAANKREPVDEVRPETFDWIVAVNLRAPFLLSQAARRVMRGLGGGKIINITSVNAYYALDTVSVYGLTKAGVRQMTAEMGVEFAPDNIQVNALTPGFVVTPMNEDSLWGVARKRAWILDRVPAGRPGLPDDMVGAVLFMASSASDFMTGQSVVVDGGFTAGGSWEYQGAP